MTGTDVNLTSNHCTQQHHQQDDEGGEKLGGVYGRAQAAQAGEDGEGGEGGEAGDEEVEGAVVGIRILEILVPRHQQVDRSSKEREKQEKGEEINAEEDNSGDIDTTHCVQRLSVVWRNAIKIMQWLYVFKTW